MTLTICSRLPECVPHKILHNVVSFVASSDGVSVIRKIQHSGALVSDNFTFGNVFVAVSWVDGDTNE